MLTLQQENERLKPEVEGLRSDQQELEQYRSLDVKPKDLQTFTTNKDAIRHYLKLVPMLVEQNDKMKKRLASLGFAMALEPIPNFSGILPNELDRDMARDNDHYGDSSASLRKTASSHTAGRSAHTSGNPMTAPSSPFNQRPTKRQRIDSPLPGNMQVDLPTSRDAMPPPKKPLSRMRSVRKIFPTLRKKFSSGRSTPAPEVQCSEGDDMAMYEDDQWEEPEQHFQQENRGAAPYMSGALQVGQPSQSPNPRGSHLLSSIGIDSEKPDFTFRASSPLETSKRNSSHKPVQIPTERSYIRLMDGLSRDDGFELGLRDPRDSRPSIHEPSQTNRQVASYDRDERRHEDLGGQENWRGGHLSCYHPTGPYLSAGAHLDSPHFTRTDNYHDRALQPLALNPITPTPRRHQQPGHQAESVVSHNDENSNTLMSRTSYNRIAEYQDSSNRSIAYRSTKPQMVDSEPRWKEPRGLNGLSFFESPVITKRQPAQLIQHTQQIDHPPPSRRYQNRNVNTTGYITKPQAGQSPFFYDSAYGSSRERPIYSRQRHTQPKAAIPFPSFNRSFYSRAGQGPSTMPSVIPGRSPVRTQPQWQRLQRMGVRSSRNDFDGVAGNSYSRPLQVLLPGTGRRTVRR